MKLSILKAVAPLLLLVASPAAAAIAPAEAPSVAPTTVVDQEEISFNDGPVRLSGTLYYPHGGRNLPLVVALHGAIEPTRDLALYTHLKQMLPPLGVAVFVFDRRGSGKSDKAQDNSLDIRAQDGVAGRVDLLGGVRHRRRQRVRAVLPVGPGRRLGGEVDVVREPVRRVRRG